MPTFSRYASSIAALDAALARRLNLPRWDGDPAQHPLVIARREGRLEVRWTASRAPGPVSVDFPAMAGRRARGRPARAPAIVRAIGLGRGTATILDANAGLGRDAFVLARYGGQVEALERAPVVCALLEDGIGRARRDPTTAPAAMRLAVRCAEARTVLTELEGRTRPDAIHLDPMLGADAGTARVKKEMRLLQELLQPDDDAAELLALARQAARRRVAVKRPRRATSLARPDLAIASRRVRWDIYLTR